MSGPNIQVWNPLTWTAENRYEITDPVTGRVRPVTSLRLQYATVVASGGLGRLMPNQWDMWGRLRSVPDSVDEFTGFYKGLDVLGGDFLGYGPANYFESMGTARVRNVRLPAAYGHLSIPDTKPLLENPAVVEWINRYRPINGPVSAPRFDAFPDVDTDHILWAADVWYSIKKHWVIALQRVIRARAREGAQSGHE